MNADTITTRFLTLVVIVLVIPMLSCCMLLLNAWQSSTDMALVNTLKLVHQAEVATGSPPGRRGVWRDAKQDVMNTLAKHQGLSPVTPAVRVAHYRLMPCKTPANILKQLQAQSHHEPGFSSNLGQQLPWLLNQLAPVISANVESPHGHLPIPNAVRMSPDKSLMMVWSPVSAGVGRAPNVLVSVLGTTAAQQPLALAQGQLYPMVIISILVAMALAIAAARTITAPLQQLIMGVEQLNTTSGMDARVPISGVAEVRDLSQAFNQMMDRLQADELQRNDFLATLTHDLKVPLLAQKQMLQYWQQGLYGDVSDEQQDILATLRQSTQNHLQLIGHMSHIHRYQQGTPTLQWQAVNLLAVLSTVCKQFQPLAHQKRMTLVPPEHPSEQLALVQGDPLELQRVLENVVGNALQHSLRGGKLTFDLQAYTNAVQVSPKRRRSGLTHSSLREPVTLPAPCVLLGIQDSGLGFSIEALERFGQPGIHQLHGRHPLSTGLGLYHCTQIVAAHGGVIWIESTEGEGAVAWIALPMATAPPTIATEGQPT